MIAEVIRNKRLKLNMKQSHLAKKLNISDIQIYRWENEISIPAIDYLIPLLKELDLNIDTLDDGYNKELEYMFDIKLKEKRSKDNKNMQDYASILGIARQTYSKWESGESIPNIDQFYDACNKLNLKPSFFFSNEVIEEDVNENLEIEKPKKKNLLIGIIITNILIISVILIILFTVILKKPNKTTIYYGFDYNPPVDVSKEIIYNSSLINLDDYKKYARLHCDNAYDKFYNKKDEDYLKICVKYAKTRISDFDGEIEEASFMFNVYYRYLYNSLSLALENPTEYIDIRDIGIKKAYILAEARGYLSEYHSFRNQYLELKRQINECYSQKEVDDILNRYISDAFTDINYK